MAKRKSRRSSKRSKSTAGRTNVGSHSFGGRKFGCYGKRVKAGKSSKRVPRIFCARTDG